MTRVRSVFLVLAAGSCLAWGQGPVAPGQSPVVVVKPGAPGQPSTVEKSVPAFHDRSYTAADVAFMQGMIHHHMQALQMVAMIPSHTQNRELRLLGEKIRISQGDEIKMMQAWLRARGQAVPEHAPGGMSPTHMAMLLAGKPMPPMRGMLTDPQMKALYAARGARFDHLFLTGMIQHHTGALAMVAELRNQPGSGLEPNIADFITGVDTDQRMEIDRMNGLLGRSSR